MEKRRQMIWFGATELVMVKWITFYTLGPVEGPELLKCNPDIQKNPSTFKVGKTAHSDNCSFFLLVAWMSWNFVRFLEVTEKCPRLKMCSIINILISNFFLKIQIIFDIKNWFLMVAIVSWRPRTFLWPFSLTFGLAYSPLNSSKLCCSS